MGGYLMLKKTIILLGLSFCIFSCNSKENNFEKSKNEVKVLFIDDKVVERKDISLDEVKSMIEDGLAIDHSFLDDDGKTPLMIASKEGDLDFVKFLVEKGADVNFLSIHGVNALWYSVVAEHYEISKFLIYEGSDVNVFSKAGKIGILNMASYNGELGIIQLLLERGADINFQNSGGVSPLASAILGDHLDIVEFFVQRGCNIELRTVMGKTPLLIVCASSERYNKNSYDIVSVLLDAGAKMDVVDNSGNSPLSYSRKLKNTKIEALLLKYGAE